MAGLAKSMLLAGLVALYAAMLDAQDTGDQAVGFQTEDMCNPLCAQSPNATRLLILT